MSAAVSATPNPPVIAAIILAAGSSRRFGADNKLLAEVDGRPLVAGVIAAAEAAGLAPILVVTGHEAERIVAATAAAGRRFVHNPRHGEGIGTSIAAGIAALGADVEGALVAQGDMPAVTADLVHRLLGPFVAGGCERIVHPVLADGRQGNPVIWPRRLFASLMTLTGDRGGKRLIEAEGEAAARIAVAGDGAMADIDTQDELAAYRSARSSQPS